MALEKFLIFSTGSIYPMPHSIEIRFIEAVDKEAITIHTCSKTVLIPKCGFSSYDFFCSASVSVIEGNAFNTV